MPSARTEGGHDAIHPELGSFDEFARLVEAANAHGLEIALDFAIQCSPDHPWIKQHPEWFDWRPDGSIRYRREPAEEIRGHRQRRISTARRCPSLWLALRDVVLLLDRAGRDDLPRRQPAHQADAVLGVADPRHPGRHPANDLPRRGLHAAEDDAPLAKIGFTQSYTYFTWRNTKAELTEYLTELAESETERILSARTSSPTRRTSIPVFLQTSGRAGFQARRARGDASTRFTGIYNGYELVRGRADSGQGGISQLREIRDQGVGLGPARQHQATTSAAVNRIRRNNPALWRLQQSDVPQRVERRHHRSSTR